MPALKNTIKAVKQLSLFTALHFIFCSISNAQNQPAERLDTDTIKGVVVDSATQIALSHVTVVIQEPGKDLPLKTTLTNNEGYFKLTKLSHKSYQLQLTCTGYRTSTILLSAYPSASNHMSQIALVSLVKQLKEVQVATQKPLVEQDLDKITYNVDADPESKTASALDILRKIPLLSVDADDNMQLNGNSSYRVLINGKSTSLFLSNQTDLFKSMPASAIKTIEVITVPPSSYEAAGVGGIINITTYKRTVGGYNGGINVRVSDPKGLYASSNLTVKAGRFSFSGNFSSTYNTSPSNSHSFIRDDKIRQSHLQQTGSSHNHSRSQNVSGELGFELNQRNIITLGYSTNEGNSTNRFTQQVVVFDSLLKPSDAYQRLNNSRNEPHNHDWSINYQRHFKKNEGRQLTMAYTRNKSTDESAGNLALVPLMNRKATRSLTENKDSYSEQILQADYTQPLNKQVLELGTSIIQRQSSSDYFYRDQDTTTGTLLLDSTQSNSFHYQEDIYAGYTSLYLKMGKWGLKTGGRLEKVTIDAYFTSSGTRARQEYLNLVPNITLSRQLKGVSTVRLSYTQRIQRPALDYIDPYVDRTDRWNINYGNPNLQPALAHVFNLAYYIFFKKTSFNIDVFRQFTKNAIQQFTILGADSIARTSFGNLGRHQNSNFSLAFSTTLFKNLGINLNGAASQITYSSTINGKAQTRKGVTYNTSGSANLRLKNWRISSNISYNAPNIMVQGKTASYYLSSITLNKYLLKNNKANFGLSVSSPFRKHRRSFTEIDDPAFYQLRSSYSVIRRINLSFNYRFVKVQGSENGKREK